MMGSRYWGFPFPASRCRPFPILVWQCPLMQAVHRHRAQQAAMIFPGPPRVEAAHYVWCSSATKRRCTAATRNRAACRRDRTARPPAPLKMHGAGREARAGWRDVVPSGPRPADKRGTVSDAGRGGRWAPSTTICTIASVGKLASGIWHRESFIGRGQVRESAIVKGHYSIGSFDVSDLPIQNMAGTRQGQPKNCNLTYGQMPAPLIGVSL